MLTPKLAPTPVAPPVHGTQRSMPSSTRATWRGSATHANTSAGGRAITMRAEKRRTAIGRPHDGARAAGAAGPPGVPGPRAGRDQRGSTAGRVLRGRAQADL